jgi:hypothetical protein
MATNTTQAAAVAEATAWRQRITLLVRAATELQAMMARNSDVAIDWSNGDLWFEGTAIDLDASGNINGLAFTPAQLSNAIGTLDWVVKFLTNQDLTGIPQADHLGNLNLVAQAATLRPDRV